MILCIAEKPSAAREIAQVIRATSRHDGYFEGNGYRVTWTFGHLCTLKDPGDYKPEWKRWTISSLPLIPERFSIKLIEDKGIEAQFNTIKRLVSEASVVINCGDAGQEGELIQRWVLQLAECKCPVKRLWLSSMTAEAIAEAFQNLRDASEFQNLYYAGLSRAIGDWILGLNATRLYTLKFSRPGEKLLSVGRVQTPTLALIVERYEEIQNFKPEPYWEIKTTYREAIFASTKGRYTTVQEAQEIIDKIASKDLTVTDIKVKKGKEGAPRLFDLTSLQVECNKKFSYTAEETLRYIQSLYEKKLTTYPRVDTTYLTSDLYDKCPSILNGLYQIVPHLIEPLKSKKLPKQKKHFDDSKVTDHHAIIPTGYQPSGLSVFEQNVYDIILKRFIAIFYPDMQYEGTTVMADIGGIEFKATGRVITDLGWKAVYDFSTSDDEEGGENEDKRTLPVFSKGEHGPHKPDLLEKETQPPKNYTEASLLVAMETAGKLVDDEELKDAMKQKGIGRPSTRAAIIETLLKRKYIRKERKSLIPTPMGMELIHIIDNELLKSVRLTGEWEYKLRLIDKGEYAPEQFLNELKEMVSNLMLEVKLDNRSMHSLLESAHQRATDKTNKKDTNLLKEGDKCPKCGKGTIIRGNTALGCSRYKEGCDMRAPLPKN
ncbi:DNA topoisomerase 3 [Porphyromonas sp.]|uniref:DNA topoisomerase 3 n=1 Tax=Porphyromonas sp. TaxID=1924944 RepID=UPI0026DAA741|nr:DNA topoisomerase 3 [Porphyromonas sp.]MDO4695411.1 DNA topoisomerase 3 [Porphyromonas sp.]MDO4770541.1 DNA topoisomerase 3 [Porphyromonas sp.]